MRDYVLVDHKNGLYCSKYEITNEEYRSFLNELKAVNEDTYNKCKIDSSDWTTNNQALSPMLDHYSTHPAFEKYPVVNIPHIGAMHYCKWLNSITDGDKKHFRLPSETEFTNLLETLKVSVPSDNAKDYACPNFNLYFKDNPAVDGGRIALPARKMKGEKISNFVQHNNGLLHLVGNVSEYLLDGRSMGGSWNSLPSEIAKIDSIGIPNPTTGFRVWFELRNEQLR